MEDDVKLLSLLYLSFENAEIKGMPCPPMWFDFPLFKLFYMYVCGMCATCLKVRRVLDPLELEALVVSLDVGAGDLTRFPCKSSKCL